MSVWTIKLKIHRISISWNRPLYLYEEKINIRGKSKNLGNKYRHIKYYDVYHEVILSSKKNHVCFFLFYPLSPLLFVEFNDNNAIKIVWISNAVDNVEFLFTCELYR